MSYCGCHRCKNEGERNPFEDFELYCSTIELEQEAIFKDIMFNSFYVHELNDLDAKFEVNKPDLVKKINDYAPTFNAHMYWTNGARLDPEHWMGF